MKPIELWITFVFLMFGCAPSVSSTGEAEVDAGVSEGTQDFVTDLDEEGESDFTPATGTAQDGPLGRGPWNKRIRIATSPNGLDWTPANITVTDQSDVPCVLTVDGELWVFYVIWRDADRSLHNTTVAAHSSDLTHWTYQTLQYFGMPEGFTETPVDPSVVAVEDGYRMYFTLGPVGRPDEQARTFSAHSPDLINWTVEGARYEDPEIPVLDPNLLWVGDHYEYFAGGEPGVNHYAVSDDGLHFSALDDFAATVGELNLMMANGFDFGEGIYRYFGFSQGSSHLGTTAVYSLLWDAQGGWIVEDGARLSLESGGDVDFEFVADPAVTVHPQGAEYGYVMVYVTAIP